MFLRPVVPRPGSRAAFLTGGLLAATLAAWPASVAAATPTKVIYHFNGTAQTWTVPPNVNQATFDLIGAAGGGNAVGVTPGRGARVVVTMDVTPGEKLQINVGGEGGWSSVSAPSIPRGARVAGTGAATVVRTT